MRGNAVMRFDGNQAWGEAMAAARANREVLTVLAGVFTLLPTLAIALLYGDQQRALADALSHLDDPMVMAQTQGHLRALALPAGLAALIQLVGQMAMMAMLTDPARPTVAEAIRAGLRALPVLFGAGLISGLVYFLGGFSVMLLFGLLEAITGLRALTGVGIAAVALLVVVALFRLSLVMPAIVVDGIRHPWAALRRSWQLTRGSVARLLWFYLLLGLAYLVLTVAVGRGISALAALALGQGAGPVVEGLVGAVITAAAGVIFTAVLAAVHRQLAR
jgi:hypothetical protein